MHARIVPIALGYEERLYKVLSAEERRSFDALTGPAVCARHYPQADGLTSS